VARLHREGLGAEEGSAGWEELRASREGRVGEGKKREPGESPFEFEALSLTLSGRGLADLKIQSQKFVAFF
jgi:hypothetical protein